MSRPPRGTELNDTNFPGPVSFGEGGVRPKQNPERISQPELAKDGLINPQLNNNCSSHTLAWGHNENTTSFDCQ